MAAALEPLLLGPVRPFGPFTFALRLVTPRLGERDRLAELAVDLVGLSRAGGERPYPLATWSAVRI